MHRKILKRWIALTLALMLPVLSNTAVLAAPPPGGETTITTRYAGAVDYTPPENTFTVRLDTATVKTFILLDTTADPDSKFLILAKEGYGTRKYDTSPTSDPENAKKAAKFDAASPTNIAYYLNVHPDIDPAGFRASAGTDRLPADILSHIDYNHVWTTESGQVNSVFYSPQGYTTTAGIALMSQTEWKAYAGRFGVWDDMYAGTDKTNRGWWFRTARSDAANAFQMLYSSFAVLGTTAEKPVGSGTPAHIRPEFYLNRSFFVDVKMDLTTLGDNVKTAIKSTYTVDELMNGSAAYTAEEIAQLGYEAPVASAVTITGTAMAGQTLTGSYTYTDADGDTETGSTYRWLTSTSVTDAVYTPIEGAAGIAFTITEAEAGKFIYFEVTPRSAVEPSVGTPVMSVPTARVLAEPTAPEAINVTVSGSAVVGETLTGQYTYADANDDPEEGTAYRWLASDSADSGYQEIQDETGITYQIKPEDKGKYIKFEVTPINVVEPTTGTAVQSNPTAQVITAGAPTASFVAFQGELTVGETLTGQYVYEDPDGDAEAGTTYRWLTSDTLNGTYVPLNGAGNPSYTLQPSDGGKYIKFEVTPKNTVEPTTGAAVASTPVGRIKAPPAAGNVIITGNEVVGETLNGSYLYSDANGDEESGSTFRWMASDSVDGIYLPIPGETSQTYKVTANDVDKYIKFEVTPRTDAEPFAGTPVLSGATGKVSAIRQNMSGIDISGKDEVSVLVTVKEVTNSLYGANFELSYDPAVLQFAQAEPIYIVHTSGQASDASTTIWNNDANEAGYQTILYNENGKVGYMVTRLGNSTGNIGDVTLGKFTFNVLDQSQQSVSMAVYGFTGAGFDMSGGTIKTSYSDILVYEEPAGRMALIQDIASAQELYGISLEGAQVGNYRAGSKAVFLMAITQAQNVAGSSTAAQTDIDAAAGTLNQAVSVFKTNKIVTPFTVQAPTFTNFNGVPVTGLTASGSIVANVGITNNTGTVLPGTLIVALFDGNGIMRNINVVGKQMTLDDMNTLKAGFSLPDSVEGYYIKVFVWDSLEGMTSLSDSVRFPQ